VPRWALFRCVLLTVKNGILGVDRLAVEFGKPGLPKVERFHRVAGMRGEVGLDKVLSDGDRVGTVAAG
jgi:hypothetical protein